MVEKVENLERGERGEGGEGVENLEKDKLCGVALRLKKDDDSVSGYDDIMFME